MRVFLISAAAIGLCTVAEAGSIGFRSPAIDASASYEAQVQASGVEMMPAEIDDTIYSIPSAFMNTKAIASSRPAERQRVGEAPPILIVISGLALIVLAGVLRVVPPGLRRLNAMRLEREGRHGRRRKVKVEFRMMA